MRSKKIMLAVLILLAVLTIGAVNASEDVDAIAVNDTGGDEIIAQDSSDTIDNNNVESLEANASDDNNLIESSGEISFEDVNLWFDGKDFNSQSGAEDENDTLINLDVPSDFNGRIIVSSNDKEFFNKSLFDFDSDNYGKHDWGDFNWYKVTPKDVNFFNGAQSGDLIKVTIFDGDKEIFAKVSTIYLGYDTFRLENAFYTWIWDRDCSRGPLYTDCLRNVIDINVCSENPGVFYVSANGKEYKFKAMAYDGGWHDWVLSSFDITEPGIYPVSITYGSEDDRGVMVDKGYLNVSSFNYDTFRVVTNDQTNDVSFFCPQNGEGTISIYVRLQDGSDYPAVPAKTHVISAEDYNKWITWNMADFGCEYQNGYDLKINVTGSEFSYEDGFWYDEYWPNNNVAKQTTLDINMGDIWNDDEWVLSLQSPEKTVFYNGTLKITSGSSVLFSKVIKYWEMDMDNTNRIYQQNVNLNELNLNGLKSGDKLIFDFTYDENGTQKTVKRMAIFDRNTQEGYVRFNTFGWIWQDGDSKGPVYLDTSDSVVSIDVWYPKITGMFYVLANGKEYRYKVNYNQDPNGGSQHWTLGSLGITSPGLYPVTITYGNETDRGDILMEGVLNVTQFNYDTFRTTLNDKDHVLALYCPENRDGTVSVFIHSNEEWEYPDTPVKTHVISPADYGKWLSWTYDELGCKLDEGYSVKVLVSGDEYYYENGLWYGEYWQRDFVPNETTIKINCGDYWDSYDPVFELYIPQNSSVLGVNLKVTSASNVVYSKFINYWDMEYDWDCGLYIYNVMLKDLNLNKLKAGDILKINFTYSDGGVQKTLNKMAFFDKDANEGRTTLNTFAHIASSSDPTGPVYLDTNEVVVSIDVWYPKITGTFYVFANGIEYRYKVNYAEDENGGWHNWMLSSFNITEPGFYPVKFTYGTENSYGDILEEGILNVSVFNWDTYRTVLYSDEQKFVSIYCPQNTQGNTISIFIRNDDAENYPSKAAVNYKIQSGDAGKWLNWTFAKLGCKLENGYSIMVRISNNDSKQVYEYENNLFYDEFNPEEFIPSGLCINAEYREFSHYDDWDETEVMELYIPETYRVFSGNLKATSGSTVLFSKQISHGEMEFSDHYRFYRYTLHLSNLKNINKLKSGDIIKFTFTYNDGVEKSVSKSVFLEKWDDEDEGTQYGLRFYKEYESNLLDDEIAFSIADFPEGVDDEFNIIVKAFERSEKFTLKISNLTKSARGTYDWKSSDLKLDSLKGILSPDAFIDVVIELMKDGKIVSEENLGIWIYDNPSICSSEVTLKDGQNTVITFVKKPNVDEKFIISIKKDGVFLANKTFTLTQLDKYFNKYDEMYYLKTKDLGITANGKYEVTTHFTRNGVPVSYNSTFDVVDFLIDVHYGDNNPWDPVAEDINAGMFTIHLPNRSNGKVVITANGTKIFDKTFSQIGYQLLDNIGAYYICLNDLQITKSGKYDMKLQVYDGNGKLLRTVGTNATVGVSPNTFSFHDVVYNMFRNYEFMDMNLGTPVPVGTVVKMYLNNKVAATSKIGVGFFLEIAESFFDNIGAMNPGTYTAKITFNNGSGEVIKAQGTFRILTSSGNIKASVNSPILTVEHGYLTISAGMPKVNPDSFILRIYIDPDKNDYDEYLFWDTGELDESVWTRSSCRIDLGTLSAGTHTIYVYYGNEWQGGVIKSDFLSNRYTIVVKKTPTTITVASKTTATYKVSKKLVVTLKDSKGKAVVKRKVTIKVGKLKKTLTTNAKGKVSLTISSLVPKTYTATITFKGDSKYLAAKTKKVKVIVKKATPKLKVAKKVIKLKNKKITATLKTKKGSAIKKAKIILVIKGKKYVAKTNKKGIATFKTAKLNAKGKFKATFKFKGNKYYKAVRKNIKVVVK